jgi:hypothetical protein
MKKIAESSDGYGRGILRFVSGCPLRARVRLDLIYMR